jgi:hypothetical protein
MSKISPEPRVKLSRLRDIGWKCWDPFGLLGPDAGKWNDEANLSFADEYDEHLISAASQLRRGIARDQVIDYLVEIETQYMALAEHPSTRERAAAVVDSILADPEIWTWPDEKGRFAIE